MVETPDSTEGKRTWEWAGLGAADAPLQAEEQGQDTKGVPVSPTATAMGQQGTQ